MWLREKLKAGIENSELKTAWSEFGLFATSRQMLCSRMLRGAVVRQITPRLTFGSAAQPQVGLLFQCKSGIKNRT